MVSWTHVRKKKTVIPDFRITASHPFLAAFPSSELPEQVQGVIPLVPEILIRASPKFLSLSALPASFVVYLYLNLRDLSRKAYSPEMIQLDCSHGILTS